MEPKRIDWNEVFVQPMVAPGSVLLVARGATGDVWERVWLEETPEAEPPDFEIQLLATFIESETVTPFEVTLPVEGRPGFAGFEVVGSSKRQRFELTPPPNSSE